jgi:hypothetical protein
MLLSETLRRCAGALTRRGKCRRRSNEKKRNVLDSLRMAHVVYVGVGECWQDGLIQ